MKHIIIFFQMLLEVIFAGIFITGIAYLLNMFIGDQNPGETNFIDFAIFIIGFYSFLGVLTYIRYLYRVFIKKENPDKAASSIMGTFWEFLIVTP